MGLLAGNRQAPSLRQGCCRLVRSEAESFGLTLPVCGSEMRLIAAVTQPEPVRRILLHVGEPTTPPPISPARSPPLRDTVETKPRPLTRRTVNRRRSSRSIKRSVGNLAASDTLSRLAGRVRRSPTCAETCPNQEQRSVISLSPPNVPLPNSETTARALSLAPLLR